MRWHEIIIRYAFRSDNLFPFFLESDQPTSRHRIHWYRILNPTNAYNDDTQVGDRPIVSISIIIIIIIRNHKLCLGYTHVHVRVHVPIQIPNHVHVLIHVHIYESTICLFSSLLNILLRYLSYYSSWLLPSLLRSSQRPAYISFAI